MEFIERDIISKDWITLTLTLAFVLISIAKFAFPDRFENFYKLFYSNRYFKLNQKPGALTDSFSILLSSINILSVSLLIYLGLTTFSIVNIPVSGPKTVFVQVMLGYSLFFIIKYFLEKITADVFAISATIDDYLFYKVAHRNFLAFLLLAADMVLVYGFGPSQPLLIGVMVIAVLINTIVLVDFYQKKRKALLGHWFYFILYLCTFEIAPYFILYKVVTNTKGFT